MQGQQAMTIAARLESTQRAISGALIAAAAAVLAGWSMGIPRLTSLLPGTVSMKPNTAIAFAVVGGLLLLCPRPSSSEVGNGRWRLLRLVAGVLGLFAAVTLSQTVFDVDFGIDQALFTDTDPAYHGAPGRMAVMTSINFMLLAVALAALPLRTRSGSLPSQWLVLTVAANSLLAVLGYLYGVESLYRVVAYSSVAVHTAALFLLACLGIALAQRDSAFVRRLTSPAADGLVIRRLLPAALLLPPLLGWLRWQGELAGLYSTAFGLALFALANVAVFTAMVWWSAAELQRRQASERSLVASNTWQSAILNSADFTVISTDPDGTIRTMNAGAARLLGYAQDELVGRATPACIHAPDEVEARARALTLELGRTVEPGFEAFVAKARLDRSDENEWTYVRKDGSRFPVRLSVTALRDDRGEITGFLGIGKDLTAERDAERARDEGEARLRLITDNLPALVAYIDHEQRYRFANAMVGRVFGDDPATLLGRTVREVRGDAVYAALSPHIDAALAGEQVSFEGRAPGKDRDYDFRSIYVPDRDEGGVRGFFAMTFDISDIKAAQARIETEKSRLRLITDNMPALIGYIDHDRVYRFNNATYEAWLGRPLSEITGHPIESIYPAAMVEHLAPFIEQALAGTTVNFEFESPLGGRHLHVSYVPERDAEGRVQGFYSLIHDVSAQKKAECELRRLSQHDSLTGLANRRRYDQGLAEAIARSERTGQSIALMILDLDRFKTINDTLGHKAGDAVLREFAKRIEGSVRRTDLVARLAGDEFVVVLEPVGSSDDASHVARKILEAMDAEYVIDGQALRLSTSIGIAVRPPDDADPESLFRRADAALYAAKAAGRGRCELAP